MALFGPPNVERMVTNNDVRGLIRALDYDRDAEVRRRAAEALGLMGDEQALAPLIFRLSDDDMAVRQAAARALGQLKDPRAIDALTALVENADESTLELAKTAIRALGTIGHADATPTLIAALVDEDTSLREDASRALIDIGAQAVFPLVKKLEEKLSPDVEAAIRETLYQMGPEAVQELALIMNDKRNLQRVEAARALGQIGNAEAIRALVNGLNTTDLYVIPPILSALASIGVPAVDDLIAALESDSTLLVRNAIDALGRIGSPRAASALRKIVEGRNPVLRDLALKALARIPDEGAIEPLIEQLKSDAWTTRRQAAIALGQSDPERAIPALIPVLLDPEPAVRRVAAASLGMLKWHPTEETEPIYAAAYYAAIRDWEKISEYGEAAIRPLILSLYDATWYERREPTQVLIKIGEPAVEPLLKVLEEEDDGVRHSAVYALARIRDPRAKEPLIQALSDPDEEVRAAATRAMGFLGVVDVIPTLKERLQDSKVVRAAAADALGMLGEPGVPVLVEALSDKNPEIRSTVADALGYTQHVDAVEPLINALLNDEVEDVRMAAARGLIHLGTLATPILVEHLATEDTAAQIAISALLGEIGDPSAVPGLYPLLGSENNTVRVTATASLQKIWLAQKKAAEPMEQVSSLFVMTFTADPEDEDLQRWLISEAFADLATDRPDFTEIHTLLMVDQSRLHETYEPLPAEGYAYEPIVARFRQWLEEQEIALEEWDRRFFHREIVTTDEETQEAQAHIVCLFYAL